MKHYKLIFLILIFLNNYILSHSIEPDVFVQSTVNRASKILSENLTKKESKVIEEVIQPNNLTRKLMKEIFDKKYNNILSEPQKRLINLYTNEKDEVVTEAFLKIKNNCLELFENYMKSCDNNILNDKYSDIKEKLISLNENDISKENLNKFLVTSKLSEEILGE